MNVRVHDPALGAGASDPKPANGRVRKGMPRSYAIFLLNLKILDILIEKGMYSAPFSQGNPHDVSTRHTCVCCLRMMRRLNRGRAREFFFFFFFLVREMKKFRQK